MEEVIVLDNYVDQQCIRHVHVMSNLPIDDATQARYAPTGYGTVNQDAGIYHFRAEYPHHGMLDIACVGGAKGFRRFVVWHLDGCVTIRHAICEAVVEYSRLFDGKPQYAYMRKLPTGIANGLTINYRDLPRDLGDGELFMFEAEWMLERSVAVGGRQYC